MIGQTATCVIPEKEAKNQEISRCSDMKPNHSSNVLVDKMLLQKGCHGTCSRQLKQWRCSVVVVELHVTTLTQTSQSCQGRQTDR